MVEFCLKKYNKPIYVGCGIYSFVQADHDEDPLWCHFKELGEHKNIIYCDYDCFVYNIKHDDIYELIKQIREYFDLSDSVNDHMGDNTN